MINLVGIKNLIAIIVAIVMQLGIVSTVETTPDDAVADLLGGLKAGDSQMTARYLDNEYVNLLVNVQGDEEVTARMYDALFANFSYEIEETAAKDDVAVARVRITADDFSGVMDAYDKASYSYIMDNLGSDDVNNKETLNAKCLELYVEQIEKAAAADKQVETVIFVPMEDNGYYGWNILLTDDLMKNILGNLELPTI